MKNKKKLNFSYHITFFFVAKTIKRIYIAKNLNFKFSKPTLLRHYSFMYINNIIYYNICSMNILKLSLSY